MTAPTLTEFLLARIAEDQAEARRWEGADAHVMRVEHGDEIVYGSEPWVRVLADCEAKRHIVEWAQTCEDKDVHVDAWCMSKVMLAHLATVYADHPDYDEAWRA